MSSAWQDRFDESTSVTCVISGDSTIVYCNPAWDLFAEQNNGPCATTGHVLGRPFFSYIPAVLKQHYRAIVDRARVRRELAESDYQCHSIHKFRKYHLTLLPIPGTDLLAMVHSLLVERPMPFEPQAASAYHHGAGNVVTMCAQCRRTRNTQQHWNWVPEFITTPPRRISHAICQDCMMYLCV
jgi:hypothetical protein